MPSGTVTPPRTPSRRWTRSLRVRIVASFALGGLLVSVALAVVTYVLADRYLVRQRERTASRQTYVNARILRSDLEQPDADVNTSLRGLDLPAGTSVIVQRNNHWFSTSIGTSRESIPSSLRDIVTNGSAGSQRISLNGTPTLVIGLPLPSAGTEYYELFFLSELDDTLNIIRNALVGAAAITTIAAALVGWWAARRVLRPIADVSAAAGDIAGGELTTRLDAQGDPDLEPLTDSFNRMASALEQRIARDARFASDVSHELRSPLTTLATTTEMLEARRDTFDERTRQTVDLLAVDVRRFQRLVAELLELSRAESGVRPSRDGTGRCRRAGPADRERFEQPATDGRHRSELPVAAGAHRQASARTCPHQSLGERSVIRRRRDRDRAVVDAFPVEDRRRRRGRRRPHRRAHAGLRTLLPGRGRRATWHRHGNWSRAGARRGAHEDSRWHGAHRRRRPWAWNALRDRAAPGHRMTRLRFGAMVTLVVSSVAIAGCGVRAQDSAQRIAKSDVPFGLTNQAPVSTDAPQVSEATIFLVRGASLTPALRSLKASTPEAAVEALMTGPTAEEVRAGLSTAVPTSARLNGVAIKGDLAVVDLAGEFLQANVGDSALGIAQFVNTLTQFPGIVRVRFELDGKPVGVPKGDGTITKSAVVRGDYPAAR